MAALLTEEQAAEILQLCTKTLRKARREGTLPYIRFGRAIRYEMDDIRQFVQHARLANEPRNTRRRVSLGTQKSRALVSFTSRQGQ